MEVIAVTETAPAAGDTRTVAAREGRGCAVIFVITEPCIGVKDASCVEVCPVNCIHEGEDQYYIDPDECIGCSACATVCPVNAIYDEDDVPADWRSYIEKNAAFFKR
jgi:NAD-dependent dihydropyrimidine dehydrogenase PreA subunit